MEQKEREIAFWSVKLLWGSPLFSSAVCLLLKGVLSFIKLRCRSAAQIRTRILQCVCVYVSGVVEQIHPVYCMWDKLWKQCERYQQNKNFCAETSNLLPKMLLKVQTSLLRITQILTIPKCTKPNESTDKHIPHPSFL